MKNKEIYIEEVNKLDIFLNPNLLIKYVANRDDFIEAFDYLSDEEKMQIIKTDLFQRSSRIFKRKCN
ncbi:MAG: hypothetical protein K6B70_04490 [Clostridia bacterium]|nr:hypothetical protein [Clostridia bacterium]